MRAQAGHRLMEIRSGAFTWWPADLVLEDFLLRALQQLNAALEAKAGQHALWHLGFRKSATRVLSPIQQCDSSSRDTSTCDSSARGAVHAQATLVHQPIQAHHVQGSGFEHCMFEGLGGQGRDVRKGCQKSACAIWGLRFPEF